MDLRCTKVDHKNQTLIGVCLDFECSLQKPYCNSCIESHSKHCGKLKSFEVLREWYGQRTISLKEIQNFVQKCQKMIVTLNQFIIPIQNITFEQIIQLPLSKLDQIIKDLCLLEKIEMESFSKMKFTISTFEDILENLNKLKTFYHQQSIDTTDLTISGDLNLVESQDEKFFCRLSWTNNGQIENLGNINSIINDQLQRNNINRNNISEIFQNQYNDWQGSQLEIMESGEQDEQNFDNLLAETSFFYFQQIQDNKINLRFRNLQNNLNVLVSQEERILRFSPFSQECCYYLDSYILPISGIYKFAFKILSIGKAIDIGIADSAILKKSDNKPNIVRPRHGTYLLSNSGQTYSHTQQHNNQIHNGFEFFENDIIIIEINMNETTITWTKLSTQVQFAMVFKQSQYLSPFIRLTSQKPLHSVIEVFENFQ